jgi:hypothetical protein
MSTLREPGNITLREVNLQNGAEAQCPWQSRKRPSAAEALLNYLRNPLSQR